MTPRKLHRHEPQRPAGDREARARQDRRLLARYHRTRDPRVREQLVERFLPLAHSVALRFRRAHDPLDDIQQVAAIGVIKAIDRFDATREISFSSFAVPTISGEIKRYLRDRTWAVRPPRDLLESTLSLGRVAERLADELQRQPTVPELVDALGPEWDDERVLETLHARQAQTATSLQAQLGHDPDARTLEERIGEPDDGYELAEQRAMLERLLRTVSPRERRVLRLRYERDLTQAQIGDMLGVSQMQVSRIVRGAVQRMHDVAAAQGVEHDHALTS